MSAASTSAILGRPEYFGGAGFARDADLIDHPEIYAAQLIRYIRDDSTVRARSADRFGRHRAPSLARIAEIRSAAEAAAAAMNARNRVAEPKDYDRFDFCPMAEPFTALAAESRLRELQQRGERLRRLRAAEQYRGRNVVAQGTFAAELRADPQAMLAGVLEVRGISPASLMSRSRFRKDVQNRTLAYALLRTCGLSWPAIGKMMGDRDHSTVFHGARVFFDRDRADPEFAAAWEALAPSSFRAVTTFEELQAMTGAADG